MVTELIMRPIIWVVEVVRVQVAAFTDGIEEDGVGGLEREIRPHMGQVTTFLRGVPHRLISCSFCRAL